MAAIRIPIGISDFRTLRQDGLYFVDKSLFVRDVLADSAGSLLLPRPRRFGKTLNLSMLRAFVEKSAEDRTPLFEDLAVWQDPEARRHFGRYPVIHLTFKDVKAPNIAACMAGIRLLLAGAFEDHRYLLQSAALSDTQRTNFEAVLARTADDALIEASLRELSGALARHHGERCIILIDEYDIPIQAGFQYGYYDEVTLFFRNFLSAGLKDNPHVWKSVLTGVLGVAKESIFSGLNNVKVRSILNPRYSDAFGFTTAEVAHLATRLGKPDMAADIAHHYDGYRFGGTTIYNPWSVLNFADQPDQGFVPYWVFTSADDALRHLVLERAPAVSKEFETLLNGGTLTKGVTEHVVLRDLDRNPDTLWSLLLMSGYLTARTVRLVNAGHVAELALPNEELRYVFRQSIRSWLNDGLGDAAQVQLLLDAMLRGDEETFAELLSVLVRRTFSYFDTAAPLPERVYQAFMLGLLVHLENDYEVRSQPEAGYGRADVVVRPKLPGWPGVVFEFKQVRTFANETVEAALSAAVQQIESRRYTEQLVAAGASPILAYGIVFDGKRVWLRRAG